MVHQVLHPQCLFPSALQLTAHHAWPSADFQDTSDQDEQAGPSPSPVSETSLDTCMHELSQSTRPWEPGHFSVVQRLQKAENNMGVVDLMWSHIDRHPVVAKRMPNAWVATGPRAFEVLHPGVLEKPWRDLGLLRLLDGLEFPHVCRLMGIFRDQESTYVVMSFATKGDLFEWSSKASPPGPKREAALQPLAVQLCFAVGWLHDLGIAHRDLSLENVLLTDCQHGDLEVKITDFGAATLSQSCMAEVCGKSLYQAPEVHGVDPYNPRQADDFSLGVTLYAAATRSYPWRSSQPGACQLFACLGAHGPRAFLQHRRLGAGLEGACAAEVLSPGLLDLLAGLLEVRPLSRLRTSTAHAAEGGQRCASALPWLSGAEDAVAVWGMARH